MHLRAIGIKAHFIARMKGFWEKWREDGTVIALIHSELSELLEALRKDNPESEKIPPFTLAEEELADVIIRIMDFAEAKRWDVEGAVWAKMQYNEHRPRLHGKKF